MALPEATGNHGRKKRFSLMAFFPGCLVYCSLGIKEPDTSSPAPSPLFSCFPDQDSIKGLAGMAMTTDFLCLLFRLEMGHGVCVGRGWGPLVP